MFKAKTKNGVFSALQIEEMIKRQGVNVDHEKFTHPYFPLQNEMYYRPRRNNGRAAGFEFKVVPAHIQTKYGQSGESADHALAKECIERLLYKKRKSISIVFDDYHSFGGQVIPDISLFSSEGKDRTTPSEVFEVQRDPISLEAIKKLTKFYYDHGVNRVVWCFDRHHKWVEEDDLRQGILDTGASIAMYTIIKDEVEEEL